MYGVNVNANGATDTNADYYSHAPGYQGPAPRLYGASYTNGPPAPASLPGYPITGAEQFLIPNATNYQSAQQLPYQHTFRAGPPNMHASHLSGQVSDLYQRQMDAMAKHAKEIFIGIGVVKDLPGSVRIYVVIQLTVSRFKLTFRNEPSLSMFIDGLDHNATMRPVRSVNGLGCKTCMGHGTGAKLFTLPHLVNHFRTVHVENSQIGGYPPVLGKDWKYDMIDLPDASIISRLGYAAGMTHSKLSLIASVFPELFRPSLPWNGPGMKTGPLAPYRAEPDYSLADPPIGSSRVTYDAIATAPSDGPLIEPYSREHIHKVRYGSRDSPLEPLEPPGEDEYDPHRPAHLGTFTDFGPSRRDDPGAPWPNILTHHTRSSMHNPSNAASQRHHYVDDYAQSGGMRTPQHKFQSHSYWTSGRDQPPSMVGAVTPDARSPQGGQPLRRAERDGMTPGHQNVYINDTGQAMRYSQQFCDTLKTNIKRQDTCSPPPHDDADAATRFLTRLAPELDVSRFRELPISDPEMERRSLVSRHGEPNNKRRRRYDGDEAHYDQRHENPSVRHYQIHGVSTDHTRSNSRNSRNGDSTEMPQRSGSSAKFYDGSGFPDRSQNEIISSSLLDAQHSAGSFGRGKERMEPRNDDHNVNKAESAPWRDASVSPRLEGASMALYRPSSPIEEDRGHVAYRSPPTSFRQNQGPRAIAYEHEPLTRYGYVDDRDFQEARYLRRVEYVPVDFEDSRYREPAPRYIMSHPVARLPSQYVHYEDSYAGQPLYEDVRTSPGIYRRGYDY